MADERVRVNVTRRDGESRRVSASGGVKGVKPAQLHGVDPWALLELAKVSRYGGEKYGDPYNYLKGYDYSLSFDALQRHALQYWGGEDTDAESSYSHLAHVAWHALALLSFHLRNVGTDDRPPRRGEADAVEDEGGGTLAQQLDRDVRNGFAVRLDPALHQFPTRPSDAFLAHQWDRADLAGAAGGDADGTGRCDECDQVPLWDGGFCARCGREWGGAVAGAEDELPCDASLEDTPRNSQWSRGFGYCFNDRV